MISKDHRLNIPHSWEELNLEDLSGTILVIGDIDVGKTTFALYLYRKLRSHKQVVFFLDGDPGQSLLGPPTTITLSQDLAFDNTLTVNTLSKRYFIGSNSPSRHMLPTLIGAAKLIEVAYRADAQAIIYDTSGLIDPVQGGLALKSAKVSLLRPTVVVAIQRAQELEPLLVPLRKSKRTRIVDLSPSKATTPKEPDYRREFRRRKFESHFARSRPMVVKWTQYAIFPFPRFRIHRLVAFEDIQEFTLALGIVIDIDRITQHVTFLTPLDSLKDVNAIRLGNILVDSDTFKDEKIGL